MKLTLTYLTFFVLSLASIFSSCEQPQNPINSPSPSPDDEKVLTKKEETTPLSSTTSYNDFISSMRNLKAINTYIESSNQHLVSSMDATVVHKQQYQPLVSTAFQIQSLTTEFHQYIYALKDLMAQESKGVYTQFDSEAKANSDLIGMPKDGENKEVVEQVFITGKYGGVNTQEQQGPVLYNKLNQLIKDYLHVVGNLWKDGGIRATIFADSYKKEAFVKRISEAILLNTFHKSLGTSNWVEDNFQNKTLQEAYLSLTSLQSQVNLSAAAVLKPLSEQMGKLELTYDRFDVFTQSSKSYVLLGETYESEIMLGAYSSQANFAVSVDGRGLSVIDGKAIYSTPTSKVGEHKYTAKIAVQNPLTGETETFNKTFKYEVGQPAFTASADKQNILYIGVDNPITIAAAGVASSALKISAVGAFLKKSSATTGYIAQVQKPGEVIITVKDIQKGRAFPFKFIAKKIPNPVLKYGTYTDGTISSKDFKAQTELMAVLEDFDYDAQCTIQSFRLTYTRKRQDAVELNGKGGHLSGQVKSAIQQAKPGDQYAFTDVHVRCSGDKSTRRISGLAFAIK